MISEKLTDESDTAVLSDNISVCTLASGSKGNAIYVSDGHTSVLVDAGLSGVEIERRMASRGLSPGDLDAIVVSHEHEDHIRGVGVLSRRFNLPVYVNDGALKTDLPPLRHIQRRPFCCGSPFSINTLTIHPFSISHDAADPAGFTIHLHHHKIGIATDLGIVTAMVREHLNACDLLVLEANHDPDMLINGPYPWHLKQRVKGRTGHLSNQDARALLEDIGHRELQHVILAHLSETNNTPEKALAEVCAGIHSRHTTVTVASQDICSQIVLLHSSSSEFLEADHV